MSSLPVRQSRRVAAGRRKAPVIEDSDDEENHAPEPEEESDGDTFTPAPEPKKVGRRGRPRKTVDNSEIVAPNENQAPDADGETTMLAPQPKRVGRRGRPRTTLESSEVSTPATARRRTRGTESAETSQLPSPASTDAAPSSAVAEQPTRRRTIARVPRKSRVSVSLEPSDATASGAATPSTAQLPTPDPIEPPQAEPVSGTPLGDIPQNAVNEPTAPAVADSHLSDKSPEAVPSAEDTVMDEPTEVPVRQTAPQPLVREPSLPRKRLVIAYLVLTDFKSYAGRQVVGPFHPSFSAVVGPNGSGKSNVIDSLLFVFGFRAKKMRQDKIANLIHKSADIEPPRFCEVEIQFQEVLDLPGGGHEPVPDSTLVVSRRAFQNNNSKYYINHKETDYSVVAKLLRHKGIDIDHKRFLILQGEVEQIAMMKAKAPNSSEDGLLEYLEDIIGSSQYKDKIEEITEKVAACEEECQAEKNRFDHVEKQKNALEEPKKKVIAFIRDENELAVRQSALYQLVLSEVANQKQATQTSVEQLTAKLNDERGKLEEETKVIKGLEKQQEQGERECEKLEKHSAELAKEWERLKREDLKRTERKKTVINKQKKLAVQQEEKQRDISAAEHHIRQCGDDIVRYEDEINSLNHDLEAQQDELNTIIASLRGKTEALTNEIQQKKDLLQPWTETVAQKKSEIEVAKKELDLRREKATAAATGIEKLEAKIDEVTNTKASKEAELEACQGDIQRAHDELNQMQSQINRLLKEEEAVRSKLAGARQKADEARASLTATQSHGDVLKGLMRMKAPGFHGQLGHLGTIDQKYDVAISTACPQLKNMVVDTVELGQRCLKHLKTHDLGRATFIVLEKLPNRDLSPIQTPEGAPRLFDLVKPKHERFRPAFFSVLQNTLVAKDLDQARRIAYGKQRWRVVTLDGQLIDKSGTMTGGGTRVARGGMSSKLPTAEVSREEVLRIEQDRDALEQKLASLEDQRQTLEETMRNHQSQIEERNRSVPKFEMELRHLDRSIQDLQSRIRELSSEKSTTDSDKKRIQELEKSIQKMEQDISKPPPKYVGLEAEIKELDQKVMAMGGVKLRAQQARVDGLKEEMETRSSQLSKTEAAKSLEERKLVSHRKDLEKFAKELASLEKELEKVEEALQSSKESVVAAEQRAAEAKERVEETREQLDDLKKEINRRQEELTDKRGVDIDLANRLSEDEKKLKEYERKELKYAEALGNLTYQSLKDLGEEESESDGLPTYSPDELQDLDKNELQVEIAELEKKKANATIDRGVLVEYRKRTADYAERKLVLEQAIQKRDEAKKELKYNSDLRKNSFLEGLSIINEELKEMYNLITSGGAASLDLADSLDPFSEGVRFSVHPPKKSWKEISHLSGGEKTLSSLALVFALHKYKPTPLYVMDEIDAALDFKNVSKIAHNIMERTKNSQFIVISLRHNMFELASRLVGVYKVNQRTKSVTLENKDYIRDALAARASTTA